MSNLDAEIARLRAELATARAVLSTYEAMILHLKLEIAKLCREQYGRSSKHRARLVEQMVTRSSGLNQTFVSAGCRPRSKCRCHKSH
ncbi:hypothetical protein [Pleomorphomonas sp. PLEO]|uniref:hypothetical protein n=1 Tax=Pleomorphomonas sp. PLEO TaxID=3239306 RepID=UPI00351F5438